MQQAGVLTLGMQGLPAHRRPPGTLADAAACRLQQDIKLAAKQGNQAGTRILAQQLVRLRAQITKMHTTQAQLRGVGVSMTVSGQAGIHAQPGSAAACTRPALLTYAAAPSLLLQTAAATSSVGQSMQVAGKAMAAMGAQNDPKKIMQNMQQFRWGRLAPKCWPVGTA